MADAFRHWAGARLQESVFADGPHPVPDARSERTALTALNLAGRAASDDECLVILLSGGASAMMALAAPGLTLDDKIATVRAMLSRGFEIRAMNAVRKHLSGVKGGWLAARTRHCRTLAISDVIGPAEDDPSVIGSGPGVADASTYADAIAAVRAGGVWQDLPPSVREHLARGRRGDVPETPKPGDPRLAGAQAFVIGSRRDAMEGARAAAERLGYQSRVIDEPTLGAARAAGPAVVARAVATVGTREVRACVISSGETTVDVRGGGRGGRNQELALAALPALDAVRRPVVLASFGTDGVDGPTDAAGAIADDGSLRRARELGLAAPDAVLDANDSYPFFDRLGDLIRTGPTGTNVGDLQIVLLRAGTASAS